MKTKTLKFKNQIYVFDKAYNKPVFTCDTIEQASDWIEDHGIPAEERPDWDYSIDGEPEAWHEQTGECGGSDICDC